MHDFKVKNEERWARLAGKDLICTWKGRRKYEIIGDGKIIAQLSWPKLFGPNAIGESTDGEWEIKRKGYFKYQYSVLNKNSQLLAGTFVRSWDALLSLSSGAVYKFDRRLCLPIHIWLTSDNIPVMRFFRRSFSHVIRIEPEALKNKDLSLLAILGLYIICEENSLYLAGSS